MTEATTRRQRLADAAITTLARAGMRGLTHRAVDGTAGVPTGTCSYYFRTRQALLQATVERLAEVDIADLAGRPAITGTGDPVRLAEAVADLIEQWTTAGRERMLARYELSLEATRRPELQAALVAAGGRHRAVAEKALTSVGVPDAASRAPMFVAFLDGIVFDRLAGAGAHRSDPEELRARLRDLLHSFARPPSP
ncbi:TetR/AcrR family transcriptional regulator [Actinoallomurus soli]|uniref:TetR/AcrR family transcriptional regulator n=1 Tax=Actinoallomurus soli TaxID=2952535 RepID=UPI00209211A2|nr:TetR/AcrR family transcriptional regulator [Actinoallomurus soli]MCO5970039.1 TetR family transcriptional regulator [Actinoallomurus soli]